jgi:Predicted phosphoesterase
LSLGLFAEQKQADAVLFGHTHIPKVEYSSTGRLLFNPGSLGEPRLGRATFGLLLMSREGIMPRIVQLDAGR